jgi:hypothetical protein
MGTAFGLDASMGPSEDLDPPAGDAEPDADRPFGRPR